MLWALRWALESLDDGQRTAILQLSKTLELNIRASLLRMSAGRGIEIRVNPAMTTIREFARASGGDLGERELVLGQLSPAEPKSLESQLRWLGERMIGPLLSNPVLRGCERLVVIADDFLADVPWHAVPLGRKGKRLGEVLDLLVAPSATLLAEVLALPETSFGRGVLVACDPSGKLTRHFDEVREAFESMGLEDAVPLTDRSRKYKSVGGEIPLLRESATRYQAEHLHRHLCGDPARRRSLGPPQGLLPNASE